MKNLAFNTWPDIAELIAGWFLEGISFISFSEFRQYRHCETTRGHYFTWSLFASNGVNKCLGHGSEGRKMECSSRHPGYDSLNCSSAPYTRIHGRRSRLAEKDSTRTWIFNQVSDEIELGSSATINFEFGPGRGVSNPGFIFRKRGSPFQIRQLPQILPWVRNNRMTLEIQHRVGVRALIS